jgi:hypothetical protein
MAELFWRTRIKRRAKKILIALPDLPADIDDNVFIALGTQAAEADKNSKAYDEFLFSEEGYEQMPYEDSVDEVLTLQRARSGERKGRAELPIKMRIEYIEKVIEAKKRRVIDALAEKEAIDRQLRDESEILTGTKKGEDGGFWEGITPDTTSRWKHVTSVLKEWLIFVLVAGADATIVFFTLFSVLPSVREALLFTIPAVGVQILFPHLTGRAIAAYRSNRDNNRKDLLIAIGIGVAWIGYVWGMTVLRINLLAKDYKQFDEQHKSMPLLLWWAVLVFSFLILVGLGSWVLIRSINSNPHKSRYSRLLYVYFNKVRALRSAEESQAKSEADLEAELKVLAEVGAQWDLRSSVYDQVAESSKSVYRRALVNNVGTPVFTTEYLPESKFKIRKARKNKNEI